MKRMSAQEFRQRGFLRELNRTWLHPLGLALEVIQEDDGTEHFGEVQDHRAEPEGIIFEDEILATPTAQAQAKEVHELRTQKAAARMELLGWVIQPVPGE